MWRYLLGLSACTLVAALALRQRFVVVTVNGDSMMPTLAPGDRVLVRRARISQLRRGQIAVVEMPGADGDWSMSLRGPAGRRQWMIKRVAALPGDPTPEGCPREAADLPGQLVPDGKLVVLGDNAASSHDSRHIGYLPGERLLGIVVRRIASESASSAVPGRPNAPL